MFSSPTLHGLAGVVRTHLYETGVTGDPTRKNCPVCEHNLSLDVTKLVCDKDGTDHRVHVGCVETR